MKSLVSVRFVAIAMAAVLISMTLAVDAQANRFIQNTSVGRTSAGAAVACNAPGGFAHWTNGNIAWYHNTGGQGAGKQTALQNGMQSWNNVSPAAHSLSYAGTTTAGFVTDNRNTVLWARGNGCNGNCLAITALVLASGQVITETDVSFSSRYSWNTNGSNYDVEAVWGPRVGPHARPAPHRGHGHAAPHDVRFVLRNGRPLARERRQGRAELRVQPLRP
jgi:hypothetical protein